MIHLFARPARFNGYWGAITFGTGDEIRLETKATLTVTTKAGKTWEGEYTAAGSRGENTVWRRYTPRT